MIEKLGLLAGDIGLSMGKSWVSKAIKFFQSWHTKDAKFSHAWIAINHEACVEALAKVTINRLSKYDAPDERIEIYRIPLTDKERNDLFFGVTKEINRAYGWLKIPLVLFDAISTKVMFWKKEPVFFFTKYFGITSFRDCSQLVTWAIYKFTSYRFKNLDGNVVSWREMTPDHLYDLLQLPINEAKKVFWKGK